MDRITQNCVVSQEEEGKNVPAGTFSGVDFQELHESAYVAITQPQRVVVIPRYFINHWLPLLGPSRAWLVLAFRQTAFVVRAKEKEVVRPIPVRQLNRWSGLSHGQVWNLLAEPGFLSWFVRKVASSPSRRESDVWGVQVSVPVAPHHLRALENYVKETFDPATNRGDALLKYLRKIAKKLPSILWKTIPAQHKPTSEIRTVHQVFEVLVGPLDSAASKVCDEITGRITQPGNTIAISHYFIDRWRKDLTSGEAWLIHLLRCQVFNSNAPVPTAFIEGGKTRLADMLGVNKRSIRRWLAKLPNNKLASFVKLDNENGTQEGLELEICIRDPLHPDDETDYQRMLNEQHSGQNWTGVRTLLDKTKDKTGHGNGQNWTPGRTKLDRRPDIIGHNGGQNWTNNATKMDTLIKTSITALNKPNNNNQPQQDSSETVVHIPSPRWGGWDLKNVLLIGSIAHNKCAKIITKIRNNPDLALRLLGWLIYGYENRQGTDQAQGINSPVLFAVSRYLHNEPAPVYLSIAGESPRTLMTYLQNHFSPDIPSEWQRVFRALKKNGFSNLLETQIGTEYADSADEVINPLPGRETSIAPVGEDPPEWASHPQAELPRSAEELWNGIKAVARIPPDFPPVSMWLNGRELAVSFANPAAYHQAKELLEKSRGAIAENYPNYSICLRLLQLSPKSRPESPQVDIIAEHRTVTP